MSEIEKLRSAIAKLEKAVAVQQTLLRTLGVLFLERAASSQTDLRQIVDAWHERIDDDRTTSATPEPLKEEEREFARQYVDVLAVIAAFRRGWPDAERP